MGSTLNTNGSVRLGILTPTGRILLVYEPKFENPKWKLPGGKIERGESPIDTAIREGFEETGVTILPEEIVQVEEQRTLEDGTYVPHFCIARVSDDEFDNHLPNGFEDDELLIVGEFHVEGLGSLADFLEPHRRLIPHLQGTPA